LTRLPAGNQEAVLTLTRRQTLTAQEVSGVIDLLQGASPEQAAFVLAKPREALAEARGLPTALRDPRLSRAGNWLARHLTQAQHDGQAAPLAGPCSRRSIVDAFEPILKELLARYPNLTVERALQELRQRGFSGGYTVVRQRVRLLRPRPAPAHVPRFETGPG